MLKVSEFENIACIVVRSVGWEIWLVILYIEIYFQNDSLKFDNLFLNVIIYFEVWWLYIALLLQTSVENIFCYCIWKIQQMVISAEHIIPVEQRECFLVWERLYCLFIMFGHQYISFLFLLDNPSCARGSTLWKNPLPNISSMCNENIIIFIHSQSFMIACSGVRMLPVSHSYALL